VNYGVQIDLAMRSFDLPYIVGIKKVSKYEQIHFYVKICQIPTEAQNGMDLICAPSQRQSLSWTSILQLALTIKSNFRLIISFVVQFNFRV
jgi:hypothetical protein